MADDGGGVEVHLVPMRRRHLASVLRIEGQVYPRPWSLGLYMSELNLRGSRHYVVARAGGVVVGYGGLMYALDEAHVATIAVDPAWQRHHIGGRLMVNLTRAALAHGSRHMTLEVRMSNGAAQALYRRFGYDTEGIRKNYYAETNEDALIMWARNIDSPQYLARIEAIEGALAATVIDETGVGR